MKKDIVYEINYHAKDSVNVIDNFLNLKERYGSIKLIKLDNDVLDSLTKVSPTHLLRALYTCKPFAICKGKNKQSYNQK